MQHSDIIDINKFGVEFLWLRSHLLHAAAPNADSLSPKSRETLESTNPVLI